MMDGKGKVVNREYNPARLGVHLHHGMRMAYDDEEEDAGANYRAPYFHGQKCGGGIREVTYFTMRTGREETDLSNKQKTNA